MLKDREYCTAPPLGELTTAIHIKEFANERNIPLRSAGQEDAGPL